MSVTADQKWVALSQANEIRSRRRQLKAQLRDGSVTLDDVLREPEWWLATVPPHELLGWAPRLGPVKVSRLLRSCGVWPLKTVGKLTLRQRVLLRAGLDQMLDGERR